MGQTTLATANKTYLAAVTDSFAEVQGGDTHAGPGMDWNVAALNTAAAGPVGRESSINFFGPPLTNSAALIYAPPTPSLTSSGNAADLSLGAIAIGDNASTGVTGTSIAIQDAFSSVAGTSHPLVAWNWIRKALLKAISRFANQSRRPRISSYLQRKYCKCRMIAFALLCLSPPSW